MISPTGERYVFKIRHTHLPGPRPEDYIYGRCGCFQVRLPPECWVKCVCRSVCVGGFELLVKSNKFMCKESVCLFLSVFCEQPAQIYFPSCLFSFGAFHLTSAGAGVSLSFRRPWCSRSSKLYQKIYTLYALMPFGDISSNPLWCHLKTCM